MPKVFNASRKCHKSRREKDRESVVVSARFAAEIRLAPENGETWRKNAQDPRDDRGADAWRWTEQDVENPTRRQLLLPRQGSDRVDVARAFCTLLAHERILRRASA